MGTRKEGSQVQVPVGTKLCTYKKIIVEKIQIVATPVCYRFVCLHANVIEKQSFQFFCW